MGRKSENLIGKKFGMLTVIDIADDKISNTGKHIPMVLCKCDCGNICIAQKSKLKNGRKKSCGCLIHIHQDIIGQKFGRLKVLEVDNDYKKCVCICDCGEKTVPYISNLKTGTTLSWGCKKKEKNTIMFKEDLTGKTFGLLTVVGESDNIQYENRSETAWICKCQCGNFKVINSKSLKSGNTISCGCYKSDQTSKRFSLDLVGEKFGKLTVLRRDENYVDSNNIQYSRWICKCDCGAIKSVIGHYLVSGNTASCGCILSKGEYEISKILSENSICFKTQYTFSDLLSEKRRRLKFDFAIIEENTGVLKCLIEYQGEQHFIPKMYGFGEQQRLVTDKIKKEYCKNNNIKLFEITYKDNIRIKLKEIIEELKS